jgi:hypothetical protein
VDGHCPFIVLSFLIRIVEALGNAAFLTASFAIIAKEFPDNVATTFVSISTIAVQFPADITSHPCRNTDMQWPRDLQNQHLLSLRGDRSAI